MSRLRPELRYEGSPLPPAGAPTAHAPAHAMDRAIEPAQSTLRYRRKPPPPAASGFVVDAVMLDRGLFWLTVPKRRRTGRLGPEHDLADRLAYQIRNATAGPRRGLAQAFELFLGKINRGLLHVCQFKAMDDIRLSRPLRPQLIGAPKQLAGAG